MKILTSLPTSRPVTAARKKGADHPLGDTAFYRAFLRYDGYDADRDFLAAFAAWAIGNAGMKHALVRAVYGDGARVQPGAFSMDSSERNFEDLFCKEATALMQAARLSKKGTRSVIASIPVGRFNIGNIFYPDTRWAAMPVLPKTRETINTIVDRIEGSKFRNLLTLDRELDCVLSTDEVLAVTPASDYETRTTRRNEPAYPTEFRQVFTKFRFTRAPLTELASSDQKANGVGSRFGSMIPFDELSVHHDAFVANVDVAAEALNLMLTMPIVGFIECEFDADLIAKVTGGMSVADVPLSLLGNWLTGTLEFQWDTNDAAEDESFGDVSVVSSLSGAKAESLASPVLPYDPAASLPERVMLDNQGRFYYMPDTDNVEGYEQELETIFTNDKGEWSIADVLNPRNVIRFTDADGRERATPRKIQANRLIFTDFVAGLISYTDAVGILKTYDVGSFRAVTNAHIAEFLEQPLTFETTRNEDFLRILTSAVHQAVAPQEAPHFLHDIGLDEIQRDMLNERWAKFITGNANANLPDYVYDLATVYANLPGMDVEFVEELRDLKFYHISPTSPLPELRVIYAMLKAYVDGMRNNFETAASNYRLLPTLERIGMLSLLASYAPNYPQVKVAARAETAAYTEQPEDYRTVDIPEVPFTRNVQLLPHQVKIFAALKRFPKYFTLDVQAGGGKTFTAVLVCLMYMKHAGIKKPIVICPNILLKNYFEDATYATSGAVNIIAINSETIRRWGPERLAELINKAPVNTVVVASFDSMAKGTTRIYGTRRIQQNSVTEFLKQFDFDMAVIDESHRIKRTSSNTNRNVARLTARAKVAGIMTGTLIFDTTKDVVGQFNLIDPTIFGSDAHFDEQFMDSDAGVKRAKFGAPKVVKDRIRNTTAYVQVQRKEWAALLPPRIDEMSGESSEVFHILNDGDANNINLTPAQQAYYDLLLDEVRKQILEDAKTDQSLRSLLAAMEGRGGEEAEDDEELLDSIMTKLNPYLARLEIFIANPTNSREAEFTNRLSSPADRTSPKAKKVVEIVTKHIERGYIGKILVFTQYNESAEGIFDALPPELKQRAVLYTASNKTSLLQFESDPSKMILVGNERSIGTGLNLQMASRIIRTESTWNWGALEQAESRVNRPVPKSKETRKALYLDWIIVNRTIDVTKVSRMISKAVESYKFINAGNALYDDMPALEPVKMSLVNVLTRNDMMDPGHSLIEHFQTFEMCRQYEEQEFQAFRRDPNIRTEPYPLNGGVLPGSGILKNVPYVAGISLYGRDELGLVPFIEYVTQTRHSTLIQFNPTDLVIHTEDGDGRCVGMRRKSGGELSSLTVELPDGTKSVYDISTVFVVTKAGVDVDTRRQVAEAVMTEHLNRRVTIAPEAPLNVPAPAEQPDPNEGVPNKGRMKILRTKPVPNTDKKANAQYSMYCASIGHAITLTIDAGDPDAPVEVLKAHGFMEVRPYYYALIKNPQQLQAWYDKARKVTGFTKESAAQIQSMIQLMTEHKPGQFFQNVTPAVLRDFWRSQAKPAKAGIANPFITIEDNGEFKRPVIYLAAFAHQNPQWRTIMSKTRVPGVEWDQEEEVQYWRMCKNNKEALAAATAVNKEAPIKNFAKLVSRIREIRPATNPKD